jgi:hypothetical protein
MKLHVLTHNLRDLNDPLSILKHNRFLKLATFRVDVLLFQEHKWRGSKLEHLGKRLMPWSTWWILEVEPEHKNQLNPYGAGTVGILLAFKYA